MKVTDACAKRLPAISVILPTFNGEKRLPVALRSLREQDVDQSLVEIVVVDDDSSDGTVTVARAFGARVVRNGAKDPERGKAIGIKAASNDIIMFIDDDHVLPSRDWLRSALSCFISFPDAVGAQPARFEYERHESAANRYVGMFGANDPVAFYLRRRDRLMVTEAGWRLAGTVVAETVNCWLVELSEHNFPPVGAQGFITRKSTVERTLWWPLYFHIDTNLQLTRQGANQFVMLKSSIIHRHSDTVSDFLAKLRRNMNQFLHVKSQRSYTWARSNFSIAVAGIKMLTLAIPLVDSFKCFIKTGDRAAFLHVYFSFIVPFMYAGQAVSFVAKGEASADRLRRRLQAEGGSGENSLHPKA